MEVVPLFSMIIGFLLIGVPIAVALGMSSVLFLLRFSESSLASVAQTHFAAFEGHFTLLAIPFFILASSLMTTGGVARRIIRFSIACVGHFPGGLAIVGVFARMLIAALSGSSPATVVAIGTIVITGMRQAGYSKEFAAGVICNASTLGILIPSSIVMVVYAASVEVSVGRMFSAGVLPGLVAGFMPMVTIYVIAKVQNLPKGEWQEGTEVIASGREAGWGIFLIIIILGGIYSGIFTPTEAAAVAAVYAFVIATFVYKDMGPLSAPRAQSLSAASVLENSPHGDIVPLMRTPWAVVTALVHPDTQRTLLDAGKLTVTLLLIIANVLILKHVLTEKQIPQQVADAMLSAGLEPVMFLVVVNIILLIGGHFMEPSGLLVIVALLVFPMAIELGIDPIHLGIIMVVNMEIGMITPPSGSNLFVTSGVAGMPMMRVVWAALPFFAVLFVFLIIVAYVPWISTFLPNPFMGPEIITKLPVRRQGFWDRWRPELSEG
ncbi:TRAP transporter large permease, partial [Roseobacter sp. YSTF-M11]